MTKPMEPAHDLALHLWQPARVKSRLLTVCSAWSTYTYAPWEGVGLAVSPADDIGEPVAHAQTRDGEDLHTPRTRKEEEGGGHVT
jgi:hypothetical protein